MQYESVGDRIKFVAEGEGSVKVSLKNDPTVFAVKSFKVVKSLWGAEHSVNKELMLINDTSVTMPGGQQYFLGVLDGGTKYVFKATLKLPALLSNQSVGIGHTIDKNDASMWFGLEGTEQGGAPYRIYLKNFLKGWANGSDIFPGGRNSDHAYQNVDFGTDTVDFIIVRDGADYWYSIGGYIGTYTDNLSAVGATGTTWVGIYSQTAKLTATNISYSVDEDEIAEAKAICESPVAKITILNADVTTVTKGATFTYQAAAFGPAAVPAITWELDKTGMTAGQDGTSITDGKLILAQDAAGVVVVTAKCGDKQQSVTVKISSESLADENELLKVDGGIVINENGSITFPEEFSGANATLNETQYTAVFYSAQLKQKVKGDFEFAFTVSNLKAEGTPKILVSLGAKNAQLFFTNNSVSVKSQFVGADKKLSEGAVTGSFTAAETLNVVVKVVGGHLQVVVNEQAVVLSNDVIREFSSYVEEQPVLLTTCQGTSCTISNIAVTDKADAEFIVLNDNTVLTEDGFASAMIPAEGGNWAGKDFGLSTTFYGSLLPQGNWTVSMDVTFSAAMADAKFAISIGNWEYHVNNKLSGANVINGQLFAGSWSDAPGKDSAVNTLTTFKVTLKKIADTVYFYIDNTLIASHANAPADQIMKFWTFDDGSTPAGETVTVENVTVKNSAVIITITGDGSLQAGTSTTFKSSVIGSTETAAWSVVRDTLTEGSANITEQGVLTFSPDAKGFVTVIVAYGDETFSKVVTVSDQPADQDTALAESKGGVKQDLANGKLIFDDAAVNGVANETKWALSEYYAILNDEQANRLTIQDNFILEFTVSNYVTTNNFPKLMISLGGMFDQFYVVYNREGHVNRIETFTSGNGVTNGGEWINSAEFANGFDTTADHTYKIKCEDGLYTVYLDGELLTVWKMNDDNRTLKRNPETMALPRNIMMSTNNGTTCEVSNISLTAVEGKEGKVTATHANWFKTNDDGSIEVTMSHKANGERWDYHNSGALYAYGVEIPDNSVITMDIKFAEGTYNDEALIIKFGSKDNDVSIGVVFHSTGNTKVEVQKVWNGTGCSTTDLVNGIKLKIVMTNGTVSSVSFAAYNTNGELAATYQTVNIGGGGSTAMTNETHVMSFGTFIYGTPSNNKVTVSNIQVTAA